VSTDFTAMAASASRAQCVLGERKRLASGTRVVAWRARLAEGAEGISHRTLRVPAPPSNFYLGEVEESDEWEEGDEPWAHRSATQGRAQRVALRCLDGPGRLRLFGRWRQSGAAVQGWAGLGWVGRLAMRLAGMVQAETGQLGCVGRLRQWARSGSPLLFNWKSVSILYFLYFNYAKHLYVRKHIAMSCLTQKGST
jgi:hypothetical protein